MQRSLLVKKAFCSLHLKSCGAVYLSELAQSLQGVAFYTGFSLSCAWNHPLRRSYQQFRLHANALWKERHSERRASVRARGVSSGIPRSSLYSSLSAGWCSRVHSAQIWAQIAVKFKEHREQRAVVLVFTSNLLQNSSGVGIKSSELSLLSVCFDHGLFPQKGVLLARLVICCCFCDFESALSWKLFRKGAGKKRRRGEYSFNRDCRGDLEHGSSAQHLFL